MKTSYRFLLLTLFLLCACAENATSDIATSTINPETYWGESPWPEIRKERINTLLPNALKAAKVDCWFVICRAKPYSP